MNICLVEAGTKLWLYRVEDAVLTVQVQPMATAQVDPAAQSIGQVVLKRLITAEQVIERLSGAEATCHIQTIQSLGQ